MRKALLPLALLALTLFPAAAHADAGLVLSAPVPGALLRPFDGGTSPASLSDKTWDELDKAGQLSNLRNADLNAFKAKYKEKFGIDYKE